MGTIRRKMRSALVVATSAMCVLGAAACGSSGGSGGGNNAGGEQVTITVDPSAIPVLVADKMGLFAKHGVNMKVDETDQADTQSLLISGKSDIAWMSPIDAANYVGQGEPFIYYSTAGALNMWNGVAVRASDAGKYKTVADLKGHKLGIPGIGSGTWTAFSVFAKLFYGIDDAQSAFQLVTADSSALLALLQKGQIDGALMFSAQSAAARFTPNFHMVFSFTTDMQDKYGVPMPITGQVATDKWYDSHKDVVKKINAALDDAVKWMIANPKAFDDGGKFFDLAKTNGWSVTPDSLSAILKLLRQGDWELQSSAYTEKFRQAVYKVVKAGAGTLVKKVPSIDSFLAPAETGS